jgi:hypothetical protein
MALICALFLIPLLLGTTDGIFALLARYQANQALLALYDYGWSNPTAANNVSNINRILASLSQSDVTPLAMPAGFTPAYSYACMQSDGTVTPATATTNSSGGTTETCSSGVLMTSIDYAVQAAVQLPFPIPEFANPVVIVAQGTIQVS